jgi:hypothetical protein
MEMTGIDDFLRETKPYNLVILTPSPLASLSINSARRKNPCISVQGNVSVFARSCKYGDSSLLLRMAGERLSVTESGGNDMLKRVALYGVIYISQSQCQSAG